MVQISHLSMSTGKTIALTIWTFSRKVMSLLFNMLPRFAITFLPRSTCLLVSWLCSDENEEVIAMCSITDEFSNESHTLVCTI